MAYHHHHQRHHQLGGGGAHQFGNGDGIVGGSVDFSGDEHDDALSGSVGHDPNDDVSADEQHQNHQQQQQQMIDADLHDKPIYLLEHLATFTVNKESGIIYPADGMRRLLQLEKTTGIWSQKMQLCLDYQWILIMDYETGNIIERFPATLIQEPTAFTSTDAMELYNNILVFIVSGGGSGARSEMHIFQSQSVSAVHLVEDLRNLRSGKIVTQQRETPMLHKQSYQQQHQQQHQHQQQQHQQMQMKTSNSRIERIMSSPLSGGGGQQQYQQQQQLQQQQLQQQQYQQHHHNHQLLSGDLGDGNEQQQHGAAGHHALNDETSSTTSDKYERDVTVLNHCFDDIEKFIARLQHAAAATRELERRRRNRKTKKKDPGEGLLTLRTRPPHEKEFIDIFAKFKLSFNLLAKLKAHIHDPNAPELVHFLFTPLALIVEAAGDTYYEAQLPARVVAPLLTREAINLLINCVTSKETELWRSLGDAWTTPRDQWKDDVIGSYHPVFLDGWSPDYLVIDELETSGGPATPAAMSLNATAATTTATVSGNKRSQLALNSRMLASAGASSGAYDDYDGHLGGQQHQHQQQQQQQQHYHSQHHHQQQLDDITTAVEHEREREKLLAAAAAAAEQRSDIISIESMERNSGADAIGNPIVNMKTLTAGIQNLRTRSNGNHQQQQQQQQHHHQQQQQQQQQLLHAHADDDVVESWLDELQASGAKIVLVTYQRTANNDKELSVVRGEYLEVLDDTRKWWKARNIRGQVAHVPHTIVTPYNYGNGNNGAAAEVTSDVLQQQQSQQGNYKTIGSGSGGGGSRYQQQQNEQQLAAAGVVPQLQQQQRLAMDSTDWIRNKHLGKKGEFRYF